MPGLLNRYKGHYVHVYLSMQLIVANQLTLWLEFIYIATKNLNCVFVGDLSPIKRL